MRARPAGWTVRRRCVRRGEYDGRSAHGRAAVAGPRARGVRLEFAAARAALVHNACRFWTTVPTASCMHSTLPTDDRRLGSDEVVGALVSGRVGVGVVK